MAKAIKPPWVVEFVGLPGAGKTTVFHPVVSQLTTKGTLLVDRNEILQQWQNTARANKIWQLIPSNLNQWHILIQAIGLALRVRPLTRQSLLKAGKVFSNLKRIDSTIRYRRCPLIILDQGFLQELWSVGITGNPPSTAQLMPLLTSLFQSRSIAVVYFNVDVEMAGDRLQSRSTKNSRLDRMQPEASSALLSNYAPFLQDILNCTRSLNIPVVSIEASLPIDTKAEIITRWIGSLVAGDLSEYS